MLCHNSLTKEFAPITASLTPEDLIILFQLDLVILNCFAQGWRVLDLVAVLNVVQLLQAVYGD